MGRFSLSPLSKQRFRKCLALIAVLVLVPLGTTYWHVHQKLAKEQCVLYLGKNNTVANDNPFSGNALICKGKRNRPYVVDTATFSKSPPSIARLITTITEASTVTTRSSALKYAYPDGNLDVLKQERRGDKVEFYSYDYAENSLSLLGIFRRRHPDSDKGASEEVNPSYGFRRNPNKKSSLSAFGVDSSSRIPVATYFWLVLNVGLYGWYFYKKVDSGKVSLNGQFLSNGGDFGRAFSGNLAHFEIWHLGLNAMSLVSLGEALELDDDMGGSPGLFLWTGSFLVLVAAWVVVLHAMDRRFGAGLWRRFAGASPPSRFPNMVGFSGILFCWSVAQTLSLSEFQQMCPIPFVSSLCFSTHRLAGGFRFSWGPIVQLVVVQALLHRRVSFVGHLAGTIVGFLWHWGILPPLEISQPCILYPVLWMTGKSALHRWSGSFEGLAGTSEDQESGGVFASNRGSHLGGGQVLGSGGSRWTLSNTSQEDSNEDETKSRKIRLLRGLQKLAFCHAALIIPFYRKDDGFVLLNSVVLSELLLVLVFSLFVRAATANHSNHKNERVHPLACLGILGRAYVAFVVVSIVTDSMAMGGWWATLWLWEMPLVVSILVATRLPLWILSTAAVCYALEAANELPLQQGSGSASDGCANEGIWPHVFGWTIAEPSLFLGKILVKAKWNNVSGHSTVASSQVSPGVTSGRSASNVAGKSRLVDRGNASNRGMV